MNKKNYIVVPIQKLTEIDSILFPDNLYVNDVGFIKGSLNSYASFTDEDDAIEFIKNNETDIFETCFEYVLLQVYNQVGLIQHPIKSEARLFKFYNSLDYVEIDFPDSFLSVEQIPITLSSVGYSKILTMKKRHK